MVGEALRNYSVLSIAKVMPNEITLLIANCQLLSLFVLHCHWRPTTVSALVLAICPPIATIKVSASAKGVPLVKPIPTS